jgi:hypothetical protein
MNRNSNQELINTRKKLRLLEEEYQSTQTDSTEDARVREVSLQSLKRLINQLKEEVARYEAVQSR